MFVNQNVCVCVDRFRKMIRNTFLEFCRKGLHLEIFFQLGGPLSTFLQYVSVQIVSDASCNNTYASYGGITARMICAAVPNGGKGPCQVIWS